MNETNVTVEVEATQGVCQLFDASNASKGFVCRSDLNADAVNLSFASNNWVASMNLADVQNSSRESGHESNDRQLALNVKVGNERRTFPVEIVRVESCDAAAPWC